MTPRERRAGRRRQRPATRPRPADDGPEHTLDLLARITAVEVVLVEALAEGLRGDEEPFDATLVSLAALLDRAAVIETPVTGAAETLFRAIMADAITGMMVRMLGVLIEQALEERDAGDGE